MIVLMVISTTSAPLILPQLDSGWRRPGSWNIVLGAICKKSDSDRYCLKYGGSIPTKDITILVSIALEYSY